MPHSCLNDPINNVLIIFCAFHLLTRFYVAKKIIIIIESYAKTLCPNELSFAVYGLPSVGI